MTDFSTDIAPADTSADAVSTTVNPASSATDPGQSQHKPGSADDAIAKAMDEAGITDEEDAPAPKPEKAEEPASKDDGDEKPKAKADEEKPKPESDRDETGKFKGKDEAEQPAPKAEKQRYPDAPQNFMPRAKELWVNTPNEVKGEVARVVQEQQQEVARYREAIQPLVRFDQMARQSGTTLPEALERYTTMENTLRANPTEGMRSLLMNMKMEPQDAIGHILRAFNVSPQALAAHMAEAPDAYTPQQQARQQEQQPQQDPRVAQLEARLSEIEQERVVQSVWEPFLDENPRAAELVGSIVQILKSGMVPDSIRDPRQRLEVAHDMAARLNPSAIVQADTSSDLDPEGHEAPRRAAKPSAANKSVRGAPNGGLNPARSSRGVSKDDAIRLAMSEIGYT